MPLCVASSTHRCRWGRSNSRWHALGTLRRPPQITCKVGGFAPGRFAWWRCLALWLRAAADWQRQCAVAPVGIGCVRLRALWFAGHVQCLRQCRITADFAPASDKRGARRPCSIRVLEVLYWLQRRSRFEPARLYARSRSPDPSESSMNPKPFSGLNHLTTPLTGGPEEASNRDW